MYPHLLKLDQPVYASEEQAGKIPADRFLRDDDVLMANIAEGTLGRVTYVEHAEANWSVDAQVMILRPKEKGIILGKWVYYYLWSKYGQREILSRRSGIAFADKRGQTHIYPRNMEDIPILVPEINMQRQIVYFLDSVLIDVQETLQGIDRDQMLIAQLEKSILLRAFTGDL